MAARSPSRNEPGRLFVMVGLPGSGKTTRAREIERSHGALRLTPDDWVQPLFGDPPPVSARDVLEGRFIWVAMHALQLGVGVVLDFGAWGREERMALRWLAAAVAAQCELVYLEIDEAQQRQRVAVRYDKEPHRTLIMSEKDLERSHRLFQVPDPDELEGGAIDPPPSGFSDWRAWAAMRWPTSDEDQGSR